MKNNITVPQKEILYITSYISGCMQDYLPRLQNQEDSWLRHSQLI